MPVPATEEALAKAAKSVSPIDDGARPADPAVEPPLAAEVTAEEPPGELLDKSAPTAEPMAADIASGEPITALPVDTPKRGECRRTEATHSELSPGDVLRERYEIVAVAESSEESTVYKAHDLQCCAACGFDGNEAHAPYCDRCGASLETRCVVTLIEMRRNPPESYDLAFEVGDRDYYVRAVTEPVEKDAVGDRPPLLAVGHATSPGQVHEVNEDYVDTWLYTRSSGEVLGLFVVADGLGGQDSGEVASRLAVDTVWACLRENVWDEMLQGVSLPSQTLSERMIEATQAANTTVYTARTERDSEMSTTLTMALVSGAQVVVANVGDSRTYVHSLEGLSQITHDHSLVQRLVDTGKLAPHEVYTHPQRNLIYQSIGDRPEVTVDVFYHTLAVDERLVLCSDGLWEMVRDEGIEEVLLTEFDPQQACKQLVHNANLAGGEDNISVIIVQALARDSDWGQV